MQKRDPGDRSLYRDLATARDLVRFHVIVKETDLLVFATKDLSGRIRDLVLTHRYRLEHYLAANPGFREALVPQDVSPAAPPIVRLMAEAARSAGVGPMAAVAGAVCEAVADDLAEESPELIMENGGDLYLSSRSERTVGIFSGEGALDRTLGIRVRPESTPLGICTSSGRIGHSLSFGDSSGATVIARSCALADAAATAVGNRVCGRGGVREGLLAAQEIPGILGALVIRNGEIGAWGEIELVQLGEGAQ